MEKFILEALQKGLIAAIAASTAPTLPVKMVGRNFKPPISGGWLEVIQMPNNITDEFWNTGKTYRGILRLLFMYPMEDAGAYPALTVAESVASYFTKGLKLNDLANTVTVQIMDNPDFKGVIEEAPNMMLPISIRYQCFKA